MNLKLSQKVRWSAILLVLTIVFLSLGWVSRSIYYDMQWEDVLGEKRESLIQESADSTPPTTFQKEMISKEVSPDGKRVIIKYNIPFDHTFYGDYYGDYFPNQRIIAVRDSETKRENNIFTGEERTGDPHWLGEDHIFFTTYCGTACKGMYLINTRNKETRLAVISYIFSQPKGFYETYFRDWFDQLFVFPGIVGEVSSEMTKGKFYLIFTQKDDNGNYLGQKRFVFKGNKVEELK